MLDGAAELLRVFALGQHGLDGGAEERLAGHRRAGDVGLQVDDVDVALGEQARDVADDARAVVTEEGELEGGAGGSIGSSEIRAFASLRSGFRGFRGNGELEVAGGEGAEGDGEGVALLSGAVDEEDAGELPRQPRHARFDPVAAMLGDDVGEGFDDAGTVGSDDGEDKGGSHGLHGRSVTEGER